MQYASQNVYLFQSTLSVRRATKTFNSLSAFSSISIHALREESDPPRPPGGRYKDLFQSTLSVRRATSGIFRDVKNLLFQSTLSVRRATVQFNRARGVHQVISIHALREESDDIQFGRLDWEFISIHALREESDSKIQHNIYS